MLSNYQYLLFNVTFSGKFMKKLLAVAAGLVLLAGCHTAPVLTGSSQPIMNSPDATAPVAAPSGPSQIVVEKLAKSQGCEAVTGATLIDHNGPVENYIVNCTNGQSLAAHCEYRNCKAQLASAQQVAAAPQPAPAPAPTAVAIPVQTNAAAIGTATQSTTSDAQNDIPERNAGVQNDRSARFMIATGANFGGDTITSVTYTNNTSANIKAGQGVQFSIGFDDRISEQFAFQTSVGYEVDMAVANNGNVRFNRYPIEFLGFYYLTDSWRLGLGPRFVASPTLVATGAASGMGVNFKDTTGAVFEIEHLFGRNLGVHFRVVNESYSADGYTGKLSGNSAGVFVTGYF
jgi:hypothetical protein